MFGSREPALPTLGPAIRNWGRLRLVGISEERLRSDVGRLLGPHSRLVSSEEMNRVENLLASVFEASGWKTERRAFRLENVDGAEDFGMGRPATFPVLEGTNVVALKQGAKEPQEALAIIAHYDTRRDTPGADDNTASIACLLELARMLGNERFRRTVLLIATDLEEVMFVGARVLAGELAREYRLRGVLVLETMAFVDPTPHTLRLESKPGLLYRAQWLRMQRKGWPASFTFGLYRRNAARLAATFASALVGLGGPDLVVLARDPSELPILGFFLRRVAPGLVRNFRRSDHVPFWDAGLPAVQITDGANFGNPHYHQPTDLPHTLDFRRLSLVTAALAVTLASEAGLVQPSAPG